MQPSIQLNLMKLFIDYLLNARKHKKRRRRGILDLIIKLTHFHNAAGIAAVAVFLVADESIEDEDFEVK